MSATDILNIVCPLFGLVFVGTMILVLIQMHRISLVRSGLENGKKPFYEEMCRGGVFGDRRISNRWNLGLGFIRAAVYDGFMTINYPNQIVLNSEDIDDVEIERYVSLTRGVSIYHHRNELPRPIILWSRNPQLLKDKIETYLHLRQMPNYGKHIGITGKKEFWPWLNW